MSRLILRGGAVVTDDGVLVADVWVTDGKIAGVGHLSRQTSGRTIDARGQYVVPGFIDIHVNGGGGRGFMEGDPEALDVAVAYHKRHGTTALLPTAVAAPLEQMRTFLHLVKEKAERDPAVLGAHLNGPFVSPRRAGAIDAQHILAPSVETFRDLCGGYERTLKVLTLAPEEGAGSVIDEALRLGVAPSIGHSDATYAETLAAMEKGVRRITHIFNAMRELGHHEPGPAGAALEAEDVSIELIADGVHVHPVVMRMLCRTRAYNGICLITDAISASGNPDGEHRLGGVPVLLRDGVATTEGGTLAGSTLTMECALRNLMEITGCSISQASRCASLHPARSLGVDDRKGSIEVGKDADLVLLDSRLEVCCTIVGGEIVHPG